LSSATKALFKAVELARKNFAGRRRQALGIQSELRFFAGPEPPEPQKIAGLLTWATKARNTAMTHTRLFVARRTLGRAENLGAVKTPFAAPALNGLPASEPSTVRPMAGIAA
jgi:hypothetical protein